MIEDKGKEGVAVVMLGSQVQEGVTISHEDQGYLPRVDPEQSSVTEAGTTLSRICTKTAALPAR